MRFASSAIVFVAITTGCAPEYGSVSSAVNGPVDTALEWPGVLGMQIQKPEGVASCTGVLIAPNLLLTARHCVSSTQPALICGESPLATPVAGRNILSTNDVTVQETSLAVRALRAEVPPDGDDECGFDIAAVILQAEVPDSTVYPPRLDRPVDTGETFTAVGYGTDGSGGIGTRRVQGDVSVACVGGADCTISVVQDTEWVAADDAFCRSDSGAPAIDADGQVIGVVSKGINPCQTPVLSSVYAWREWIRSVGRMAAEEGAYPPPTWAEEPRADAGVADAATPSADAGGDAGEFDGGASDAGPRDGFPSDAIAATDAGPAPGGGGCSLSHTGNGFGYLLIALWALRRRRRVSVASSTH